jgi:hypothetical protein
LQICEIFEQCCRTVLPTAVNRGLRFGLKQPPY